jgi:hypothetical protein
MAIKAELGAWTPYRWRGLNSTALGPTRGKLRHPSKKPELPGFALHGWSNKLDWTRRGGLPPMPRKPSPALLFGKIAACPARRASGIKGHKRGGETLSQSYALEG